jgi:threonine dehydrogenase-like Zn-dependent dehydrogenase
VVFEAVGGKASTFAQAVGIAARGGRVGFVGSFLGPQEVDPRQCMRKELNLHWVWSYGMWEGIPEYKIALDMMAARKVEAAPLITHRFPLDRIGEGFAAADNKRQSGAIKVLIVL